ncbi:MAG: hypothetical protein LHV68_08285 [Elusimicrobia bacterium]|nr:hypothetical protein [Candidatus Liberimonas magnetica]
MNALFEKKWVKTSITVILCIISVYVLIYIDVVLRARSAYLEGEKYFSWYSNPEIKKTELLKELEKEKAKLDKKLSKGKISQEDYNKELEIIKFDNEQKLNDSSIKYAYVWYQTVVELFSPPESKWVKLAREKMPKAKELWKKELTDKGIPFEDYMLE